MADMSGGNLWPAATAERSLHRAEVRLRSQGEAGTFEALVSRFGVTYRTSQGGERIERGAFRGAPDALPVYVMHEWRKAPVGSTSSVREMAEGLVVRGRFFLDSDVGRRVWESVKDDTLEWSIGFFVESSRQEREDGRTVEVIERARLVEVSSVTLGAVPGTETLRVAARPRSSWSAADTIRRIVEGPSLPGLTAACRAFEAGEQRVTVELPEILTRATTVYPTPRSPEIVGRALPAASRFVELLLLDVLDLGAGVVQWVTETTAPTEGGAAPYGTALASIAATITATDLEAKRYGASAIVHVRTIEREAIFERFVGTIMRRALLVALERGCLVGAGAPNQIEGLTNRTTITSLARGTDSRFVGLVKAVEALTGAGFGPELVACFSPATWRDIVTDGSPNLGQLLAQVLPDLRLIVAPSLPAGAGVIGSLETTSLVRDAPPVLEISRDHSDVFTRSEAAVRLEGRFELVAAPEGWRRLTGY